MQALLGGGHPTEMPEIDPDKKEEMCKEIRDKLKKTEMKNWVKKASKENKLKFYGQMMQMSIGDCDSKEPKKFQFKKHVKWEAWHDLLYVIKCSRVENRMPTIPTICPLLAGIQFSIPKFDSNMS